MVQGLAKDLCSIQHRSRRHCEVVFDRDEGESRMTELGCYGLAS